MKVVSTSVDTEAVPVINVGSEVVVVVRSQKNMGQIIPQFAYGRRPAPLAGEQIAEQFRHLYVCPKALQALVEMMLGYYLSVS